MLLPWFLTRISTNGGGQNDDTEKPAFMLRGWRSASLAMFTRVATPQPAPARLPVSLKRGGFEQHQGQSSIAIAEDAGWVTPLKTGVKAVNGDEGRLDGRGLHVEYGRKLAFGPSDRSEGERSSGKVRRHEERAGEAVAPARRVVAASVLSNKKLLSRFRLQLALNANLDKLCTWRSGQIAGRRSACRSTSTWR